MAKSCSSCGHERMEPGFIEDSGQSARGYVRWIQGPLETGVFGGAKRFGRDRWRVEAYRCARCSHLDLYASSRS